MTELQEVLQEVVEIQDNQDADKKEAAISLVENPEDDDPENPRPTRIEFPLIPCCIATVVLSILFVIIYAVLLGSIVGIQDESDPYFTVVVSPFSNDYSTYLIVTPCYYPVLKNVNETDVVACDLSAVPPDTYFCPINYTCMKDENIAEDPTIGCFSVDVSCGDTEECVSEIDDLSFINKSHREKELSLEYSKWHYYFMLLDGAVGFISIIILIAAIVLLVLKKRRIYSILLVITSNFTLVAAYIGMIGASEGIFHYTRGGSGDCYSDTALNDALDTIADWSDLFVAFFVIGALLTILMMAEALVMFAIIHLSFWKNRIEE